MSINEAFGGPDVPGEATDKARALIAVLTQLHTQNLEEDGLIDGYSQGVHLLLMEIDDLLKKDAEYLARVPAGGKR